MVQDRIMEAIMKMGGAEDQPVNMINACNAAYTSLLTDKMKSVLDKTSGKNLTKAANITVEYLNDFWGAAMQGKTIPQSRTDKFIKDLQDNMRQM